MKDIKILLIILSLSVVFSCTDDSLVSSLPTGTIMGFVTIMPNSPYEIKDHSNVDVIFENTNFSTTTDSIGKWLITDIPQGTYDIKFSKEGFGAYKRQGFQFVGNGTTSAGYSYLRKSPTFSIIDVSNSTTAEQIIITFSITDTVVNPQSTQFVRYFIGETPNVEANTLFYIFQDIEYIPSDQFSAKLSIHKSDFDYYGFQSGEKAYMKIYPESSGFTIAYRDIYTGATIYPALGLNSSDVFEIVVP
jgi:hypothetical protein